MSEHLTYGELYEGGSLRPPITPVYSPWTIGCSSIHSASFGPSLPQMNWERWLRMRWGLSYVPLALLGIGLWAAPLLAGQLVATTPPPVVTENAQVKAEEAPAMVEVLEPVRRSAEVKPEPEWAAMRKERPTKKKPQDAQREAGGGIVLSDQPVHATFTGEESTAPKPKVRKQQNRPGPDAEIPVGVFTNERVMGLVDDWLIPLLVDSLVRERLSESREGQAP